MRESHWLAGIQGSFIPGDLVTFVTTFFTSGSGGLEDARFLLFSPEPGTWLLVACGLAILFAAGRKTRRFALSSEPRL